MKLKRRTLLRGAGVCLALPTLESFAGNVSPKRLVAINLPLGLHSPNFFPEKAGRDYGSSPYLDVAGDLRDEFTVISGTSHPEVDGGHAAEKTFLTAAPHPGSRGFRNTISLDQQVAAAIGNETRFASLTTGGKSLSWTATGVPIPVEESPARVFSRLFLSGSADDVAQQKRKLQDGHSILDTVLEEAEASRKKVSRLDQEKLDQYFTAVRETEVRLTKAQRWIDTPKPEVDEECPRDVGVKEHVTWMQGHFDVTRLALQTDSTRVVAFSGANHSLVIPLPGVSMGHHNLTHHGKNPEMIRQLEIIEVATMELWADFLRKLKAIPDGDGSLLDQTQVLLGSNLGNASGHITTNLPVILAGGGFQHGQHLAFDRKSNYPLPNLFVSMMQQMGMETGSFASSTGTMTGLA